MRFLAFAWYKPMLRMSGSMSETSAFANAKASGYAANKAGVTLFTEASVVCALNMTAQRHSKGVEK
jgi:hypothetical protein